MPKRKGKDFGGQPIVRATFTVFNLMITGTWVWRKTIVEKANVECHESIVQI